MTLEPPFAFIDFEASGLGEGSWPIEIGWAIVRPNRTIESASYLIQPAPHWDMAYWSDESQKVHGITIDDLQKEGLAPKVVAETALQTLAEPPLLSDAPRHDQYWLDRLFEAANMQLRAPILQYVSHAFEGPDIDEIAFHNGEKKLTRKRSHRALQDALDWAELYLACNK